MGQLPSPLPCPSQAEGPTHALPRFVILALKMRASWLFGPQVSSGRFGADSRGGRIEGAGPRAPPGGQEHLCGHTIPLPTHVLQPWGTHGHILPLGLHPVQKWTPRRSLESLEACTSPILHLVSPPQQSTTTQLWWAAVAASSVPEGMRTA